MLLWCKESVYGFPCSAWRQRRWQATFLRTYLPQNRDAITHRENALLRTISIYIVLISVHNPLETIEMTCYLHEEEVKWKHHIQLCHIVQIYTLSICIECSEMWAGWMVFVCSPFQCLSLTESLTASLPPVAMRWWHKDEGPKVTFPDKTPLDIPLFLNHART